jgi:hypothetical protein
LTAARSPSASKPPAATPASGPFASTTSATTFATQLAASGKVSLRTLPEFLGHADAKTTQIYAHYAPSAHEIEMVNAAFAAEPEEAKRSEDRV